MRIFNLNFDRTDHFGNSKRLILFKPFKSSLYRTCNIPETVRYNKEFFEVCNTLSANKGPINGVYYFKGRTFDEVYDLSLTLDCMDIDHLFIVPDYSPIMVPTQELLN